MQAGAPLHEKDLLRASEISWASELSRNLCSRRVVVFSNLSSLACVHVCASGT